MNMKLTNISLAVLVALGLVACGGSSSNDDATKDKTDDTKPTIETPDTNDANKPTIENNGKEKPQDPHRAAPSGNVEKNLTDITADNKALYIDRQSRDAVAGYNGLAGDQNIESAGSSPITNNPWTLLRTPLTSNQAPDSIQGGLSYNPGSTDKPDILRASSIYNYFEEQSNNGSLNEKGGIHANPAFSYAKSDLDGKYYRVKPAGNAKWDTLDANSTFEIVSSELAGSFGKGSNKIPMDKVVFIPNALADNPLDPKAKYFSDQPSGIPNEAVKVSKDEFKNQQLTGSFKKVGINVIDPENVSNFDISRSEVKYKSFDFAGKNYDLVKDFDMKNIKLDLSQVPVAKEIKEFPIKLNYEIFNGQSTAALTDDDHLSRDAKVGAMKLYNLPYSRSSITINQAAVDNANDPDAAPNNLFGLVNTNADGHYGAYQVVGFQTPSLPRDGRADYVGKSYGINSEGDIHLNADFGINRAGIHGSVRNRKTADGRDLPILVLQEINLSGPTFERTASEGMLSTSTVQDGVVLKSGADAGRWAVALYGPNAEEAAGVIDFSPTGPANKLGPDVDKQGKDFEVFSTQRGSITVDSLNPGVGN